MESTKMVNPTGNLTLSGITDAELVKLSKSKCGTRINSASTRNSFSPLTRTSAVSWCRFTTTSSWGELSDGGLEAVQQIVHMLLKKEEAAKAEGQ